jgi:hypothetical protein
MEIEEEIKIRKPKEIILDQIQFKKRISVGQNIFEYPIAYHTRKLIIQTPIVYIPYSTYKVESKITFDFFFLNLDVDKDMEDLKLFVEGVDKKAIEKINLDNSRKIHTKQTRTREFISNIKKSRGSCMGEKPDRMRVSLYDNIMAFDDLGKSISLDYLRYKTYLKLLLTPTKIWINGQKYGVFWEVLQVKIYPKTILNKYMFIDDTNTPSLFGESSSDFVSSSSLESFKPITQKSQCHPKFFKYFDMLKKGVPKGAVKNKMLMENVDPNILDSLDYKSYKSISASSLSSSIIPDAPPNAPPPPPPPINFNQHNSINIMLSNKPISESTIGSSVPSMNAIFNDIKIGNTLLRKVKDHDKNTHKKHFSKKKPKLTCESSFTPSLDDIVNARNSLKKR